jgi:hypothetical protein
MKEHEPEQPQKDSEVEIGNLDPSPPSPARKPRFSPRRRMLFIILLNSLLILALVLILVNTASVRELVSSVFVHPTPVPSPVVTRGPSSVLFPTFPANARLGGPGCLPPSPLDPSNAGIPEAPGTTPARDLWALFLSGIPVAKNENKIALRVGVHFQEPPHVVEIGPDGQHISPLSFDEHESSSWNRPGVEWGAVFIFPVKGCWDVHVTGGTTVGDVWIVVS